MSASERVATKNFGEARSEPPEVPTALPAVSKWGNPARARAPDFFLFFQGAVC